MTDYSNKEVILSVRDLKISFKTDEGLVHAVRGVSFDLYKGETLCIVGESGSGKSVTSKTIMGILPASAVIEDGQVMFEGEDLTKIDESEFHRIRGHKIGMIFQDPLSSLNPIMKVGKQITEAMLVNHNRLNRMYDNLISKEEASFKNNKVRRDSRIAQAESKIEESDEEHAEKLNALTRKEKDLAFEIDETKDPKVKADLKNQYTALVKENKEASALIKADMKKTHHELSLLAKKEKKAAKAEYRKDKPIIKKELAISKKNANKELAKYKALKKAEYQKKLADLNKEEKDLNKQYSDSLALLKRNISTAASKTLAKKAYDDKCQEFENKKKEFADKKEQAGIDYQKCFTITKKEAKEAALNVMKEVGIPQPEIRFKQYPFEFSGGMRQRIVIAIALTANPEVLICDEPTTALDVTIQAQILELINKLKRERNMSIIFITHDLGVVANMADRVAVMYAGKIVEVGTANEIFYDPRHPYTWALLSSIPDIDSHEKLEAIPGTPPYLLNPPKGDAFAARNKYALAVDFKEEPPFFKITDTHYAATWLLDGRAPKTEKPRIVSQRIKASLERAGIKNESELEGK